MRYCLHCLICQARWWQNTCLEICSISIVKRDVVYLQGRNIQKKKKDNALGIKIIYRRLLFSIFTNNWKQAVKKKSNLSEYFWIISYKLILPGINLSADDSECHVIRNNNLKLWTENKLLIRKLELPKKCRFTCPL